MLDFNIAPYFDDTNPDKDYYRVLFTPGKPVQTRELNSLQSILQHQIRSHGNHIFKDGDMVVPGNIFYDNRTIAAILTPMHNGVNTDVIIPDLVGKTVQGQTTGVTATVVHYDLSINNDLPVLHIKYLAGSEGKSVFEKGEVLKEIESGQEIRLSDNDDFVNSSICTIDAGIYYVGGIFCRVARQTLSLNKYSDRVSCRVGLNVIETIVTEKDDPSLYDNALGYSNYAAPGAHRYHIYLQLTTKTLPDGVNVTIESYNDTDKFIDLLHVKDGRIVQKVNYTKYSEINKMLARRTYDESGDYEVTPFKVVAEHYRNNSRGEWKLGLAYVAGDVVFSNGFYWEALTSGISGATQPILDAGIYRIFDGGVHWQYTAKPFYNDGVFTPADDETLETQLFNESKITYKIYPGKAYIKGFEVELQSPAFASARKARGVERVEDNILNVNVGTYTEITNLEGIPNIDTYELVDIYYNTKTQRTNYASYVKDATAEFLAVNGAVQQIVMTDGGYGYDKLSPPAVSGGDGVYQAVVGPSSEISRIDIYDPGTTNPDTGTFTIASPPGVEKKIGTCRVRAIEYVSGIIGTPTAVYRLQLFDVRLDPGYTWEIHAHSLAMATTYFSCDIVEKRTIASGVINAMSGTTYMMGNGTYFLREVYGGQHVIINGERNMLSDTFRSEIEGQVIIPFTNDVVAAPIELLTSSLENRGSFLIPFPKRYVRSVRSSDDKTISISYSTTRRFNIGAGVSANLTIPGETFGNPNVPGSYLIAQLVDGMIVNLPVSRSPDGRTVTIDRLGNTESLEMIAIVNKVSSAAKEKSKTPKIKTIELTNKDAIEASEISLTEADAIRILSVKVSGAPRVLTLGEYDPFLLTDSIDITEKWQLNDGKTPFFYGISTIKRNRGVKVPENAIQITFEYYDHGVGDFFTVDSYVDVPYNKIPLDVRDVIDIRPRIDDAGVNYSGPGSSVTEPFAYTEDFVCDYSYYLPRRDRVELTTEGLAVVSEGEPGYGLKRPVEKSNVLALADVILQPYTIDTTEANVLVTKLKHKRYTMKDIGKLESRIENLEYYTQLTLLEKNTIEQDILDQNGLSRYKAGILVDQFTSLFGGNAAHKDHQCSIDLDQNECRALAEVRSVDLIERYTQGSQKLAQHYQLTGNVITLPYVSVPIVQQLMASDGSDGQISCNPFSIIIYKGHMVLIPPEDNWMEEERLPERVVNIGSGTPGQQSLGTQWNDWETIAVNSTTNTQSLPPVVSTSTTTNVATTTAARTTNTTTTTNTTQQALNTTTTTTSQERAGTESVAITETDTVVSDDLKDINWVPFIRSRPVIFKATGLKPFTKFYPFFDNISVMDFCTPLEEIVISYDYSGSTSGDTVLTPNALTDADNEFFANPSPLISQLDSGLTGTELSQFMQTIGEKTELHVGVNNEPRTNVFRGFWNNGRRNSADPVETTSRRVRPNRLFQSRVETNWGTLVSDWMDPLKEIDRPLARPDNFQVENMTASTINRQSATYTEGDLIVQYNGSGTIIATALCVEVLDQMTNGAVEKVMKIVNRTGVFDPTGSAPFVVERSSGVKAKILGFRNLSSFSGLTSNSVGTLVGEFLIPNREDIRFPIGVRTLLVTDDQLNRSNFSKVASSATAEYHALGLSKIRQTTTMNITTTSIVQNPKTESRQLTDTSSQVISLGTTTTSNTTTTTENFPPPVTPPPVVPVVPVPPTPPVTPVTPPPVTPPPVTPVPVPPVLPPISQIVPEPQPRTELVRRTELRMPGGQQDLIIQQWFGGLGDQDPVAQTFTIPATTDPSEGAFVTGATVYFTSKPQQNINVWCELKNVVNGYPGDNGQVIARKVLTKDEVFVHPDSFIPFGLDHTGTTFKFDKPVYLEANKEYALVVGSASGEYYIRCAMVGTKEFGKPSVITQQPHAGSLFTSQNGSTWSADQVRDLAFVIHAAQFDISKVGNAVFFNKELQDKQLPLNSLYAIEGSNKIKVSQSNHGFMVGDKVRIGLALKGPFSYITGPYLSSLVNADAVDAVYDIVEADYDYYVFELFNNSGTPVVADFTTTFGGADMTSTYQLQYSTLMPNFDIFDFDKTDYRINVRGVYGETPLTSPNAPYKFTDFIPVTNQKNTHFKEQLVVASAENEKEYMSSQQSLEVTVDLVSSSSRLSPVITVDRASIVCVRNKINSPTTETYNLSVMDDVVILTGSEPTSSGFEIVNDDYSPSDSYMETTETVLFPLLDKLSAGKYINISNPAGGTPSVLCSAPYDFLISRIEKTKDTSGGVIKFRIYFDETTRVVNESSGSGASMAITMKDRFVHELAPDLGSTFSNYVTKIMHLDEPSTGLRVTIDSSLPTDTMLEVWYRSMLFSDQLKIEEERWYQMQPLKPIATTNDFQVFTEITWEATDVKSFDVTQVKVVFKSNNVALTPRIKNFRMLALS